MKELIYNPRKFIYGPVVSLPTLFKANGEINYEGMFDHLEYLVDHEMKILMLTSGMSEYIHLNDSEVYEITKYVTETVDNRAIVIAGTKPWDTKNTIVYAKFCEDVGVDVLMILPPDFYYTKYNPNTHDKCIYKHFQKVAEKTYLPIFIHEKNLLGRSVASKWSLKLLRQLFSIDTVIGLKEESLDPDYRMETLSLLGDNKVMIDSASNKNLFSLIHKQGKLMSFITCVGQFSPKLAKRYWNSLLVGNLDEARRIATEIVLPIEIEQDRLGYVPFIKYAMDLKGYQEGR